MVEMVSQQQLRERYGQDPAFHAAVKMLEDVTGGALHDSELLRITDRIDTALRNSSTWPSPPLAATGTRDLPSGTVVAQLRMPLPIGEALVRATSALEDVWNQRLVLLPTSAGDEFVRIAIA